MQQQICPRCKFRLTNAKAICSTCGYALHSGRRQSEVQVSAPAKPVVQKTNTINSTASLRPAVANNGVQAPTGGGGSFWRTFFGLDPLPSDKADRDEPALGET